MLASLAAGLYYQGNDLTRELAGARMTEALARPWAQGVLVPNGSGPITAAAFSSDGSRVVTADSFGVIAGWDTTTDQVVWTKTAVEGRVDQLDVNGEGTQAVLAGPDSNVNVIDIETSQRRTVQLPDPVRFVSVLPDGAGWAASTEIGRLYTIDPTMTVHEVGQQTDVLALQVSNGRATRSR